MRIGFDAKRTAQNRTGLGNYSRFVVRILSERFKENEYHMYIPKASRMPFISEIPTHEKLILHFPKTALWKKLASIWRVLGITSDIKAADIDIYHGLSNELPLNIKRASCKSVVTIHDVIFRRYPQYYHAIDRWIYNYKFRRACQVADRVIAVSEFTKQEIIHYYNTPAEKIDVVYQGCDKAFAAPINSSKLEGVRSKYNLPQEYILYVGSIEERKNLMLVARALKRMERKPVVIAVGKKTPYVSEIANYLEQNNLSQYLHFFHNVPFADIPSLYRMATAFVYPSRIEGFGIPLLEALTSGVPAIGCTGSCLEEAGGESSIYVDPDDPEAMAKTIESVMGSPELRATMIAQGKEYAKRFADEKLAEDIMKVYNKII